MSKMPVELVCGAKLKGISTRRPHVLRRPSMKKQPCTVIEFTDSPEHQALANKIADASIQQVMQPA